jgi:ribulose bisphosphate carboxylase small subunit
VGVHLLTAVKTFSPMRVRAGDRTYARGGGFLGVALTLAVALGLAGCDTSTSSPSSDSTPPTLSFSWLHVDDTQSTVNPGDTATVTPAEVTKPNQYIRVNADDNEGVKRVSVTWSGSGRCHTNSTGSGLDSPEVLTFHFDPVSKEAAAGSVLTEGARAELTQQLIHANADGVSCGVHHYGTKPTQEFFWSMGTGTITVQAHAENCCGGGTDGTFTIKVP